MLARTAIAATLILLCAEPVRSQQPAAHITGIAGVVRDSMSQPMPNVDIVVIPAGRRARTDSAGRFDVAPLEPGRYEVRARHLGYVPAEWDVDLSQSGHAEIQLVLVARIASLDTVYVNGTRPCPRATYEGFLCRRATAKGTFIDYPEIDAQDADYSADLLRDVPGFGVAVGRGRTGATRIPSSRACTIVLLNGVASSWAEVPESPWMISAIEIYQSPNDIPKEFSRYTWGKEHCWLVAYWTYDVTMKSIRRTAPPTPQARGIH